MLLWMLAAAQAGSLGMSDDVCPEGEVVLVWVETYDTGYLSGPVSYSWVQPEGFEGAGIEDPTAEVARYHCPDCPPGEDGDVYSVYVVVMDEDGHQDWSFDSLPLECAEAEGMVQTGCGCATGGGGGWWLAALVALVARRRRA